MMMKKGRNLLDKSRLLKTHPELQEVFYSTAAYHGKIIFARRMEKGLTQSELAKKADVGLKTISKAEGGAGNLGIETYDKIYNALQLTPAEVAEKLLLLAKPEEAASIYSYA